MPIFLEITEPLDECDARAAEGTEWLMACPKQYRIGAKTGGMKGANLVTVFDDIVVKAGMPTIPMAV